LKSSVHRALTVLGVICEYRECSVDPTWNDEMENAEEAILLPEADLTWENYGMSCNSLFKSYLSKKDSPTKCRALAALKGLFVAHPHLLLQMDHVGLFDDIMSNAAGEPLQLEALECWRNILEAEERRIDSGQADAKMEADGKVTLSKRISGDQNGDATLFGGVLTSHSKRLFEMTKDPRPTIRLSTLQLLGLLLRQGLLNPNEVVPHLFALQGDTENEGIRSSALRLLIMEGDKRPDTLRQRICAGVKEAYNFQRLVYPAKRQVSAVVVTKREKCVVVESIFGSVFEECIVKNRKQRFGLYKTLLGLFEVDHEDGSNALSDAIAKDLALLSFAAQILAHLPYNTASDPLYIIHHLTSITTLQGLYITDRFAELLRPYGVSSDDELDESNASEDAFEKAAGSKFPSRTQEARPLMSKDFDMKSFVRLVHEATSVTLLLRLKNFLCTKYNLSASRCLDYDPMSKERLCDKGIPVAKFSEAFDATVADSNGVVDKDILLRQYAEFRRCMRLENTVPVRFNGTGEDLDGEEDESSRRKRSSNEIECA
jgi:cohesin loading factor subunit SCC2